jgi:hypothetical protein
LADRFADAVARYHDWTPSIPELEVSIDRKPFTTSAVCSLVDSCRDKLPEPIFDRLLYYMDLNSSDLKERLAADRTYATVAYCFRELIRRRIAGYQRLEEARRSR